MSVSKFAPAVLGLMALVAMASPGCGGGDDTENASTASGSASSSSTSSSSGAGGEGGAGGTGGAGGGGGATAAQGPSATETVSAGEVSKSAKYKMVFTFGQPTQNQQKTTSSSYRLQGGLTGANGSLP